MLGFGKDIRIFQDVLDREVMEYGGDSVVYHFLTKLPYLFREPVIGTSKYLPSEFQFMDRERIFINFCSLNDSHGNYSLIPLFLTVQKGCRSPVLVCTYPHKQKIRMVLFHKV